MVVSLRSALAVLALLGSCAAQQGATPMAPPRTAKILKEPIDGLIHWLRDHATPSGGLGNGTCRQTAQVLAAAGNSHRFYHVGDGPWVRAALKAIVAHRRPDGSFTDGPQDDRTLTSRWVLAALDCIDPQGHAAEIDAVRKQLGGNARSPLAERVAELQALADPELDRVGVIETQAAAILGKMPRGVPTAADDSPDPSAAVSALVALVACQIAARDDPLSARLPEGKTETVKAEPWLPEQQKAWQFLQAQQQDGVFAATFGGKRFPDVGLTGIGVAALQTKPKAQRSAEEQAIVQRGLDWLRAQQDDTGAFGQQNVNYATCAAMMALAAAQDPRDQAALTKARQFIVKLQNCEDRGYAPSDRDYGSIGYGGDERGDLSNLQFAADALRGSGLDVKDEAFTKAIVFLQRTQNLQSHNDFTGRTRNEDDGAWFDVAPGDDGGAAYYPGNSPAGYVELPGGVRQPRSYGSMTYALLKAYILCGLAADDPRVVAAVAWIQKNWRLDVNPGHDEKLGAKVAYQGLFYSYMVMAQALHLAGVQTLVPREASGSKEPVDWRSALRDHLLKLQQPDGSWVNSKNGRWWEDQPLVCTVYVMLALDRCHR